MKKLVLVLAIFCSVGVMSSYAIDIKEQKKEVTKKEVVKIENALSQAIVNSFQVVVDKNSCGCGGLKYSSQSCSASAWDIYRWAIATGESPSDAFDFADEFYHWCLDGDSASYE